MDTDSGYAEVYCDGASSGNPGNSGIGVVINPPRGGTHYKISEYIGVTTNNVAEYSALIKGLEKAKSLGLKKIKVFLDSELVVKQINGIYKVKNINLRPLWMKARIILEDFDSYKVIHIDRVRNSDADTLAKNAIKRKQVKN